MATKKSTNTIAKEIYTIPEKIDPINGFYGLELDKEQEEFVNAILDKDINIVFCNSIAGAGKTTCAIGASNILVQGKRYDTIIYVMAPYNVERQGYLPGTQTEKSAVYFEQLLQAEITCGINPFVANIEDSLVDKKNGDAYIKAMTDSYVRGSNFEKSIVILDEAQNYTAEQLQTLISRIKDDCKLIIIGHTGQIDIDKRKSGFAGYINFAEYTINNNNEEKPNIKICNLTTNHRGKISRWGDSYPDWISGVK